MQLISLLLLGVTALRPSPGIIGELEADRARIQRHLAAVEADLRARDVDHLPDELRAERARNLDRLRDYRLAGEFPHNDDFPGERVPYFIDDDGVLCAVGHLVVESGHPGVAREIQRTENNARLLDMVHPALPGWIAASGLTEEECARIQPSYCECTDEYAPVCGVDGQSYANACYAQNCAGVEVAYTGVCKAEATTTGWPSAGSSGEQTGSTGADAGSGTGSDTGSGTGDDDTGDDEPEARKGCDGCRSGDAPGSQWLALLLLAFARRRARS